MNRRRGVPGALLLTVLGAAAPVRSGGNEGAALTLADLETMALERNPTLKQAAAEVEAARGRALQSGLFPNPSVGYVGEEVAFGPIIRGGEHGLFVEQTLPISGKLGLSRAVFTREIEAAEALAEAQKLRVLNSVRLLFRQAIVAGSRVDVGERLARVTREAVGVSAELFNVGAADRPDVLESEIEERRAQVKVAAARNLQARVWIRLATAVGAPELTPRPLAGSVEAALPELERQQLLDTLLRESPEIKAARAAVGRSEAALRRARREPVPDLVVRAGPRYNRELLELGPAGNRPVGWEGAFEVGITLPLFDRNQGNIRAARAELARAQAEVTRVELSLRARLADVFDDYLSSLRMAEVFRGEIIPRAREAYDLHLARFREMAASYPQVLVAQRTLVQVNEDYLEKLDCAWRAAIRLQGLLLDDGLRPAARPGDAAAEEMSSAGGAPGVTGAGRTPGRPD
jgi:cobalt-zinc-cadmium efflux system outer membrane protein